MKKAYVVTVPEDRPLTPQEFDKLFQHAVNSSVWYATTYNRSEQQLRDKLKTKGYPTTSVDVLDFDGTVRTVDIIEDVMAHLRESLVVDDRRIVESAISSGLSRGEGKSKIQTNLLRRGIDRVLISELLEAVEDSEEAWAALDKAGERALASSAYRRIEEPWKRKQKLMTTLASKGFSFSDISTWLEAREDEEA